MHRVWVALFVVMGIYAVTWVVCWGLRTRKRICVKKSATEAVRLSAGAPGLVASCGTLLGTVRSSGVIPNDDDVDLHVMPEDWEATKQYVLTNYDRKHFKHVWRDDGSTLTLRCKGCGALGSLDIYRLPLPNKDNKYTLFGTSMTHDQVAGGAMTPFEHGSLRTPRDSVGFLATMYGASWKVPQYLGKGETSWRPIDIVHSVRRGGKRIGLYV
jgi:hypothetical protein